MSQVRSISDAQQSGPLGVRTKQPILVTGAHRSGSTWIGRMLAEAPHVFYIHEPFSVTDPPGAGICNAKFQYWFTYVTAVNEMAFYRDIKNTIDLKYNWTAALKKCRSIKDLRKVRSEHQLFSKHRREGSRLLIKDPLALFSAEWLANKFDMKIVVVVRHPAAFVSSIKKLDWPHPFAHFVDQPFLMNTVLAPFAAEIRDYSTRNYGIVDQAILLWKVLHFAIAKYQEQHKEWIFIRHEDISRDPIVGFADLYERLNLNFSDRAKTTILEYSNETNPEDTDAPVGSETTLKRDSRINIWNWKSRLTLAEIELIKEKVEDVSRIFYATADW